VIRTFVAGLFFWFALLGLFTLPALVCGLAVLGFLLLVVPPLVPTGHEAGFLLRFMSVVPEAYLQGLRLLLGVRYAERTRAVPVPFRDSWGLFEETFMVTFTPENLVLRTSLRRDLVVHDLEAEA